MARPAFAALIALCVLWPVIGSAFAGGGGVGEPASFVDATSWSGIGAAGGSCVLDRDRTYLITGQAWGDVDGNGTADLYVTDQCGPSTLYTGLGDGHFQVSPLSAQVALAGRQAGGAVFADLDSDGLPELLVLTYDGPVLFHNDAGRGFTDVTASSGLVGTDGAHPMSAALSDYDQDGALDIFISAYGCVRCLPGPRDEVPSRLFHNRGGMRFVDVSDLLHAGGPMGFSFAAGWGDFDDDGDQDLYVTNDVRGGHSLHGNALYRNDGQGCAGWCFTDVSRSSAAGVRADAMGLAVADFDGDGALDIFITNSGWAYTPLTGPSLLLSNQRDGTFREVAAASGAAIDAMGWGAAALDADNDGWKDLYVALGTDPANQGGLATTNRLMLNTGSGRFEDATRRSGAADAADSFGVAAADANGDGQADVVVGDFTAGYRLFLGTGGGAESGHRLVVRLRGAGRVNSDAVGARIEVLLSDGRRLVHEVSLGATSGGNDDTAFRTGTGAATVSQLTVRWPDGSDQVIGEVPIDSEVRWTYATEPEVRPLPPIAASADRPAAARRPSEGPPTPIVGALASSTVAALWISRRRRSPLLARAADMSPTSHPALARPHRARPSRSIRLGGTVYPVVLPSLHDPRLHLASVITSLQVLGQTVLGFELSIAQILVSVLTCVAIELVITLRRTRSIVWPASAMLTGNGVAFILRVPGTAHGDWWSLNGWYVYAGVAGGSLLSKHLLRQHGRHIFNPSNLGLVLVFLLLGSGRVEPLYFWWGPISPGVLAALAVIAVGALTILWRLRLLAMALAFWATFAAGLAVIASAGHCMTARWSFEPLCGGSFWWVLVTSPELFVFMFFMMTDPKTTPEGRVARLVFGAAVGFVAALFVAPQQTEFASKVAVLASLVLVCAIRPSIDGRCPAAGSTADSIRAWSKGIRGTRDSHDRRPAWNTAARRSGVVVASASVLVALLVVVGFPARLPAASLAAADAIVSRPDIAIDPSTIPPVTIDPSVRRLNAEIAPTRADAMARDVAADLEIERLALERGDHELAKTAAAGARLDRLLREIDAMRASGRTTISTYTFESITLVPVYDTANAQAGPRYGLETQGTVHRLTYDTSNAHRVLHQEEAHFDCTFALLERSGTFLIAADLPNRRGADQRRAHAPAKSTAAVSTTLAVRPGPACHVQ